MSVKVAVDQLHSHLVQYPWAYLVTVSDTGRTHAVAVPAHLVDGSFEAAASRSTLANVAARADVTMIFPPSRGTEYSLIVDGRAEVVGDRVRITPTGAVLHRPALHDDPVPGPGACH